MIVNDVFGGDLVVGEVHLDGTQDGFHWWNRLPKRCPVNDLGRVR
ncbi:YunG family protein [Streptomyces sp. LaBMicrA B280]